MYLLAQSGVAVEKEPHKFDLRELPLRHPDELHPVDGKETRSFRAGRNCRSPEWLLVCRPRSSCKQRDVAGSDTHRRVGQESSICY